MKNFKHLGDFILKTLPNWLTYPLLRNQVHISYMMSKSIEIKVADSFDEMEQAFALVYSNYVRQGLQKSDDCKLRVSPYNILSSTSMIVAKKGRKVIGTLSIVKDSPMGLPSDEATDLSSLRSPDRTLAELSALAILPKYKGSLLLPLTKYAYELSTQYLDVSHFVAVFSTKRPIYKIYEAILLFEKVSTADSIDYTPANGLPVTTQILDLKKAYRNFQKVYGRKSKNKNIWYFFTQFRCPNFKMPVRKYLCTDLPTMSTLFVEQFFVRKSNKIKEISERKVVGLLKSIKSRHVERLIRNELKTNLLSFDVRRTTRFNMNCPVFTLDGSYDLCGAVKNISRSGMKAQIANIGLDIGQEVNLTLKVSQDLEIDEKVKVIWQNSCEVGLQLVSPSLVWTQMIEELDNLHFNNTNQLKTNRWAS